MGGPPSDAIPESVFAAQTNKIAASRSEVANMMRPAAEMAPLVADEPDVLLDAEAIERHARAAMAAGSGDALPATTKNPTETPTAPIAPVRETLVVALGAASLVPATGVRVEIRRDSVPVIEEQIELPQRVTDHGIAKPALRAEVQTTLGVAPLEPATVVRAPYVIDTPAPSPSPLPWTPKHQAAPRALTDPSVDSGPIEVPGARPERTAMAPLDPGSGMPRSGPWTKALSKLAKRVRSVRWWISKRRRTEIVRRR